MSKQDEAISQLELKLTLLTKKVDALEQRIAYLERDHAQATGTVDADGVIQPVIPDGLVPRGKYAGKTHEWVVGSDPHHVCWLADNGKAAGLGYMEEHVAEAEQLARQMPDPFKARWR